MMLGTAGAVCGLALAVSVIFGDLQDFRAHREFISVASSPLVRHGLENWHWWVDQNAPIEPNADLSIEIGAEGIARVHLIHGIFSFTTEQKAAIHELNSRDKNSISQQCQTIISELKRRMTFNTYQVETEKGIYTAHALSPTAASIESIERTDGTILSNSANLTPGRILLALMALLVLPLTGYLLPVVAIRAVVWVSDGFVSTR